MNAPIDINTIVEDFEFLDDWDDRYRYLIELGNGLEPLDEAEKNAATKVQGCVSQVWIVTDVGEGDDPVLRFRGDSDAHIVRGLIAVALALFSGRQASQIAGTDESEVFDRLHLSEHITPQRSNGLRSMVARIKAEAAKALGG
ncbi:MAG: SufE family protein [Salaquimonas sp.]|jgi:cysteine desulfuration protein SufE|nr:SufE family protein [Salaquimonas sp.]